jgi:hypothetical protein
MKLFKQRIIFQGLFLFILAMPILAAVEVKKGEDLKGKRCERVKNAGTEDESSTSGRCENVCQGKDVDTSKQNIDNGRMQCFETKKIKTNGLGATIAKPPTTLSNGSKKKGKK